MIPAGGKLTPGARGDKSVRVSPPPLPPPPQEDHVTSFQRTWLVGLAIALTAPPWGVAQVASPLPSTPKQPVSDVYQGITVVDDYRWLESFEDPAVRTWSDSQNAHTRALLDGLPARAAIARRLRDLVSAASGSYWDLERRGGSFFAVKYEPSKQQPLLVTLRSPDDPASEHVVLDANRFDSTGGTTIDFFVPSPDGRLVAVSLSRGGSEDGTLHVFETTGGRELGDTIAHIQYPTALGSLAWTSDSGFYYTRYPARGERPDSDLHFYQQVYFHQLGTPTTTDRYVLGKEFPRIAEVTLTRSEDGRYFLATVANGDGGEFAHYVAGPSGRWTQVTGFADHATRAALGTDGFFYLVSVKDAPRGRVLRVSLEHPAFAAAQVVAQQDSGTIQTMLVTAGRLYLSEVAGGPSAVRVVDLKSRRQTAIPLPPASAVLELARDAGDGVFYVGTGYTAPPAWYRYDPATSRSRRTALFVTSPADFGDAEVVRAFATSRDGTKVPMSIIRRKATKLDGQNPTLLYGYGGFGISETPTFSSRRRVWLDQGGVYVVANLRGGSEYGEEWHRAGNLTRKQNVFDDFIACARWLIDNHYTNPDRLAIEGGSNGGLLMGAVLTQRPALFRAVASYVGIYDMLRVELSPNGAFNTTEFGSVKDTAQFRALYAYSPYHHVVDGTRYPAVYLQTGEHDGRVDPMNSRKMAARLQRASGPGRPTLLWTTGEGHGFGTPFEERITGLADEYAFLFDQLRVTYQP